MGKYDGYIKQGYIRVMGKKLFVRCTSNEVRQRRLDKYGNGSRVSILYDIYKKPIIIQTKAGIEEAFKFVKKNPPKELIKALGGQTGKHTPGPAIEGDITGTARFWDYVKENFARRVD